MAEFKIRDKESGEVFTIREKDSAETSSPATPSQNTKTMFRDALKGSLRAMAGQGISEFVPGLESQITKSAAESGRTMGQNITDSMGVPKTPNMPVNIGNIKGNINPNSVTSNVLGGLLDPRSLAGMATPVPGMAMEKSAIQAARPGAIMLKSRGVMKQAEELATQILQPTTKDLTSAISNGRQLPSIKRGAENIVASKTFEDMVGHLKQTTKELFDERQQIFDDFSTPWLRDSISKNALDELSNTAESVRKQFTMSPSKVRQFDNVFYRELEFLDKNPNMEITTAQSRKESLQELTRPLLEKRKAGTLTGAENVELQAYDALRNGYRKAILKALPKDKANLVDRINSKYEGLLDATELASRQAATSLKEVPKSLLEKVSASFGLSPKFTAFRLATKEVAGLTGKTRLERTTNKISELRTKSETLRNIALMARQVNKKP